MGVSVRHANHNDQSFVTPRRSRRAVVFSIQSIHTREGRMRRLLIALAIIVLPSFAMALGHGGGGGGHGFAGGHGGFGGWHGHGTALIARGPRMAAWSGHMAAWNGHVGNWNHFNHGHFIHRNGHFVHRHGRVFFVGGPRWWDGWGGYGYYDDGCWQWVPTPSGLRHVWVCGDYY